jgi:hypothetical protein
MTKDALRQRGHGLFPACSQEEAEVDMDQPIRKDVPSVYRRDLPGGGYVAIEVERELPLARTRVSVERRAIADRREGHKPIVIAEADGDERSPSFNELYRIAADNAAIARALMAMERGMSGGRGLSADV